MVKRAGRFRSRGRGGHGGVVNQRAGRDVSSSDEELERELGVGDAKHSSPRANGAENEHKLQLCSNVWMDEDGNSISDVQDCVFVFDKLTEEYGLCLEEVVEEYEAKHSASLADAETKVLQCITYTYKLDPSKSVKVLYVDSSDYENVQDLYTDVFKKAEKERLPVLRMPLLGVRGECTDETILNNTVAAARVAYEKGYQFSVDLCHAHVWLPPDFDLDFQSSLQLVPTQVQVPDGSGSEPDGSGSEPDESGSEPDESGSEPDGSGSEPDESGSEPDESGSEPDESGSEPDESNEEPLESEPDDDVQGVNNEDDDDLRVDVAPQKRNFDEVQTEQNSGRKRYKEGGAVKTTFLLLDQVDKKESFDRPVMDTQTVESFLISGFNKGTLSIDLQTNRAMEISREAVSVFFHSLLQPNNLFIQTLVVERIILLNVDGTKYLVSGQHRGAMFLLLHLGMVPVLTAQNKPFFVRRAEANNYDGSVYNYDAPGLNPDIKWGYKNWQKWQAALKRALNKSGRIKQLAQKKLKKYNSCFEWIYILQRLKCFHEVDDEQKSLLDAETFANFYNADVCFFSVSNMSRQDLYKFFVSSLCVQKPYCFDIMVGMSCGELIGIMKDKLPIYEARDNIVLQNLYLRSALPNNDPTSSFYVDVALAIMLIEGTTGALTDVNLRNAFNSLIMFSAKEYSCDDMLASLLLFEKMCENSPEFKSRTATRFERVVRVLNLFDNPDPQIQHRRNALKLFMRTGGFKLRDALVLFWYRVMNVTNSSFDPLENCDFTAFVVPNGASLIPSEEEQVYKPETKTGLFNDLLQLVRKPKFKLFKDVTIASHEIYFPWVSPPVVVQEEDDEDDEDDEED